MSKFPLLVLALAALAAAQTPTTEPAKQPEAVKPQAPQTCAPDSPKKPSWKDRLKAHVTNTVVGIGTIVIDHPVTKKTKGAVESGAGDTAGTAVAQATAPKTCAPQVKQ
jgi:hypothetical protein